MDVGQRLHHPVHDSVLHGLLGGEPAVPVAVAGDGLHALPGVLCGQPLDGPLDVLQVLRLDLDVRGGAADARRRWCIMIRAFGSAYRLPGGVPTVSRNWPMLAAKPMASVDTSFGISRIVS